MAVGPPGTPQTPRVTSVDLHRNESAKTCVSIANDEVYVRVITYHSHVYAPHDCKSVLKCLSKRKENNAYTHFHLASYEVVEVAWSA